MDDVFNPGDLMCVPRNNHLRYEADDKCVILKELAGVARLPVINLEDMPNSG